MAVDANSYGTAAGVAVLVPQHANNGETFDSGTQPTISTVESWIDQLSAAVNLELAAYGYSTPATGNLNSWLDGWVQEEVAAQVRAVYQRTRRGPTDGRGQEEGPRSLLTNIQHVRNMLDSLKRGNKYTVGSQAVTRKDAYSDEYTTIEADS